VARVYRRPHNEKLRNLYASPNIISVIKSREMRWAGQAARMGEMKNTTVWLENLNGKDHMEDLDTDGKC
jgi:hypothetical protein